VTLAPSAMLVPPQGGAHGTSGGVQSPLWVANPAQAAPPQAGTGLSQVRCWVFCPSMHVEVSTHALQPPLVGVTAQAWLVYAPERTPQAQVRVCGVQLPPQATDGFW